MVKLHVLIISAICVEFIQNLSDYELMM